LKPEETGFTAGDFPVTDGNSAGSLEGTIKGSRCGMLQSALPLLFDEELAKYGLFEVCRSAPAPVPAKYPRPHPGEDPH